MSVSRDKSLTAAKPSRTETEKELGQKKKRGRKEEGEEKFRDHAKKENWAKVFFFKQTKWEKNTRNPLKF